MIKIFVVGNLTYYTTFIKNCSIVNKLENADIVLFTGGEDVDPSLYNSKKLSNTFSNIERDLFEKDIFNKVKPNQLCIGICRGSQFLCVMNGGLLVQDCNNHALFTTHEITNGKMCYEITSTHHQMQYPYNLLKSDYDILFYSHQSDIFNGDNININEIKTHGEPEITLYHKENLPKCLAIQGHPEMIPDSPVCSMINKLIRKLIKEN